VKGSADRRQKGHPDGTDDAPEAFERHPDQLQEYALRRCKESQGLQGGKDDRQSEDSTDHGNYFKRQQSRHDEQYHGDHDKRGTSCVPGTVTNETLFSVFTYTTG
jgi:hypothetical protein